LVCELTNFSDLASRLLAALRDLMRDADRDPVDSVSAAALVARVIAEVDRCSGERRDEFLVDLLCAAWPSRLAQEQ
jgi:hypothetical protein